MNLSEFKAWFSGFSENLDDVPTAKQWKRIKEKISHIKDAPPVTEHVFHHDYYTPWRRYWYGGPIYQPLYGACTGQNVANSGGALASTGDATAQMQSLQVALAQNMQASANTVVNNAAVSFDSSSAFHELGRAEARSLSKDKKEE